MMAAKNIDTPMIHRILIAFAVLLLVASCQQLCSLDDTHAKMIEAARSDFHSYCDIDNIACETYYLNVRLKGAESEDSTAKLHKMLYHQRDKSGWQSLHVYDKEGQFLITHHYSGKRSNVAPRW